MPKPASEIVPTHAFIGYRRCGKAIFMAVDEGAEPSLLNLTLYADVLECLRIGGTVDRVELETARRTELCFGCAVCQPETPR